jgi:hypothetical protein
MTGVHLCSFKLRAVQLTTVLLCAASLSSCFVRRRVVTLPGKPVSTPLLTATKDELVERVHRVSDPLQSFSMRMNMSPSVGSVYVGEVKDYATFGGYILFRKGNDIRVLAQDPVMSSTVVDMASTGNTFRVYIPSKNRFIEGRNDAPAQSKNTVENLRPEAFLTSLIIEPPDAKTEITLLEEDTTDRESVYILLVVRQDAKDPCLVRTIHFDRQNLNIIRQKTYDMSGNVLSDTRYADWKPYDGIPFPAAIDIKRPQDHYELTLDVVSLRENPPDVTPEKFILNQPPGTELQQLPKE